MVPLPTHALRPIRGLADDRRRWAAWLASLTPDHAGAFAILKDAPDVTVYAATVEDRPVVIKVSALTGLARRAYAALGSTRGCRHWRGSHRLRSIGLHAPACLALIHARRAESRLEVLIMERVPGRTLLDHLARPTLAPRVEHALARALARQCATMARAGVFNRDHKPSNIMVVDTPGEEPTLSILDTVAIRPLARAGPTDPPLERLLIEAIGIQAAPRRTLVARFLSEWIRLTVTDPTRRPAILRATWRTLASRIAEHGDPTPTDNPMSPPVGA